MIRYGHRRGGWRREPGRLALVVPGQGDDERDQCREDNGTSDSRCRPQNWRLTRFAEPGQDASKPAPPAPSPRDTQRHLHRGALLVRIDHVRNGKGQFAARVANSHGADPRGKRLEIDPGPWRHSRVRSGDPPDGRPPLARITLAPDHGDDLGPRDIKANGKVLLAGLTRRRDQCLRHRHRRHSLGRLRDRPRRHHLARCLRLVNDGHGNHAF
jgi:hypothetical protein